MKNHLKLNNSTKEELILSLIYLETKEIEQSEYILENEENFEVERILNHRQSASKYEYK
jgi:hypothetical protein